MAGKNARHNFAKCLSNKCLCFTVVWEVYQILSLLNLYTRANRIINTPRTAKIASEAIATLDENSSLRKPTIAGPRLLLSRLLRAGSGR